MKKEIILAAQICVKYHYGQVDKAGNPYYLHPFAVASKCKDEKEIIVALLHDILEDTDYPAMNILTHFGQEIFDAIVALTRGIDEKYSDYIKRVSENPLAKSVKKKDIEHNLEDRGFEIPQSLKDRYIAALILLSD